MAGAEEEVKAYWINLWNALLNKKPKQTWYYDGLINLLTSINAHEEVGNRTMNKLVCLIQLLAQKEESNG